MLTFRPLPSRPTARGRFTTGTPQVTSGILNLNIMKKHIVSIIAIIVSFIASVAWGASPAFENFKAGMFSRSGNTIQIADGATNAAGKTIATTDNAGNATTATNLAIGSYSTNHFTYTTNTIVIYSNGVPIMVPLAYLFGGSNQTYNVGDWTVLKGRRVSEPSQLIFADSGHASHGVLVLGGLSGDVVLNPTTSGGLLQLGATSSAGNEVYLQYASNPLSNSQTMGFSHPLTFKALGITNGSAENFKHYPGMVGFSQPDSSELGELWVYARTPFWNAGNHNAASPNTAGTPVVSFGTNGIIAKNDVWFRGPIGSPSDVVATNDVIAIRDVRTSARIRAGSGTDMSVTSVGLDISSGINQSIHLGADLGAQTRTTAVDKYAYVTFSPRTLSQPPVTAFVLIGGSGDNNIRIGGGTSANQPATQINFYTGAAGSASAGTVQMNITSGLISIHGTNNIAYNGSRISAVGMTNGAVTASSGYSSLATATSVTTTATGLTNNSGVNYIAYVTAATGLSLTNNAGTAEFYGVTVAAFTPIRVQPGGKLVGTSITYASGAGGHAW